MTPEKRDDYKMDKENRFLVGVCGNKSEQSERSRLSHND